MGEIGDVIGIWRCRFESIYECKIG